MIGVLNWSNQIEQKFRNSVWWLGSRSSFFWWVYSHFTPLQEARLRTKPDWGFKDQNMPEIWTSQESESIHSTRCLDQFYLYFLLFASWSIMNIWEKTRNSHVPTTLQLTFCGPAHFSSCHPNPFNGSVKVFQLTPDSLSYSSHTLCLSAALSVLFSKYREFILSYSWPTTVYSLSAARWIFEKPKLDYIMILL